MTAEAGRPESNGLEAGAAGTALTGLYDRVFPPYGDDSVTHPGGLSDATKWRPIAAVMVRWLCGQRLEIFVVDSDRRSLRVVSTFCGGPDGQRTQTTIRPAKPSPSALRD